MALNLKQQNHKIWKLLPGFQKRFSKLFSGYKGKDIHRHTHSGIIYHFHLRVYWEYPYLLSNPYPCSLRNKSTHITDMISVFATGICIKDIHWTMCMLSKLCHITGDLTIELSYLYNGLSFIAAKRSDKVFGSECDIRESFDTKECPNIFVSTKLYEWIFEYIHINLLTWTNVRISIRI